MAKTGITVPDKILEDFDDQIWEYQKEEVLPKGRMRSALISQLMADWLENPDTWIAEHEEWVAEHWGDTPGDTGNRQKTVAVS